MFGGLQSELNYEIQYTKSTIEPSECESDLNQTPMDGDWCTIECRPLFDSSAIKTASHSRQDLLGFTMEESQSAKTTLKLRLGYFSSQISMILHKSIGQMSLNELAHVSFEMSERELDEAFVSGKPNKDESEITIDIKFEVKLIGIERVHTAKVYNLSASELYEIGLEHKQDANELFKRHFIKTAFKRYHKSISYLIIAKQILTEKEKKAAEPNPTVIPEEEILVEDKDEPVVKTSVKETMTESDRDLLDKILTVKSQLHSNIAACQLKAGNNDSALINCTKCLEHDKTNVKALVRRAQARLNRNDFDEAISDLKVALDLDATSLRHEILSKISTAERLKKNYNAAFSNNLKKMFASS